MAKRKKLKPPPVIEEPPPRPKPKKSKGPTTNDLMRLRRPIETEHPDAYHTILSSKALEQMLRALEDRVTNIEWTLTHHFEPKRSDKPTSS